MSAHLPGKTNQHRCQSDSCCGPLSVVDRPIFPMLCRALVLCLSATLLPALSDAQRSSGGEYTITCHTIDNGGTESSSGIFRLAGTLGQVDAAPQSAEGEQFRVSGGFWAKGSTPFPIDALFSDGFERR